VHDSLGNFAEWLLAAEEAPAHARPGRSTGAARPH
jgi:hypothetical protein